jgi:hypothetical protein
MNRPIASFHLILLVAIVRIAPAAAAEDCPFIRPAGLSPAKVDELVLAKLTESLGAQPRKIDKSATMKSLDGAPNARVHFALFVVGVGESLGFDSGAAFHAKAREKGVDDPFDSVTVAEYQSAARAAYAKGKDRPPPAANANVEYKFHKIAVRPPSPSKGWVMLRCSVDQIMFQRRGESTGQSTAITRTLSLPAYKDDRDFLEYTRREATSMLSSLGSTSSLEAMMVPGIAATCSQFKATVAGLQAPYTMHARFCYSDKSSRFGYAALFSHLGPMPAAAVLKEAQAFMAGASPK